VGIDAIRRSLSPLSNFSRCESSTFVRRALTHALRKDLNPVSTHVELVPTASMLSIGASSQRSNHALKAIKAEEEIKHAAKEASAQLKKARLFFEQAQIVGDEIKPILYYYGGIYFLDFVCLNLVRREAGGGHGLSANADSKGWDFDRNWSRDKCWVQIESRGDFPYYIDTLAMSGWTTLFSSFRLRKDLKSEPWVVRKNPAPLFPNAVSLDFLCNFNRETYLKDNPEVIDWLVGTPADSVWKLTSLLADLMVVFVAASLARYYTPAWNYIIEADKDDIYNDIRTAYRSVSEGFALFFEDEYPFQYSYETRIPPY